MFPGRHSRTWRIASGQPDLVLEEHLRPRQSNPSRSPLPASTLLGRKSQGRSLNQVDPRVSRLEADFHLTSLVMDPLGLQECRQNAGLH